MTRSSSNTPCSNARLRVWVAFCFATASSMSVTMLAVAFLEPVAEDGLRRTRVGEVVRTTGFLLEGPERRLIPVLSLQALERAVPVNPLGF
jgi:hypothetical protein